MQPRRSKGDTPDTAKRGEDRTTRATFSGTLADHDSSLDKAALFGIGELAGKILEDLNVWLNIHDENLNMIYWNRVAERISGYSSDEVLGHAKVWEWCYPEGPYRNTIQKVADEIVGRGETITRFQNEIVCRNGERRYMSWNSHPLVDSAGCIRGAITVGYDLTELERSRAALRRANEELSVLYDVASVASESLELGSILERCLERVLASLGGDGGMVHLTADDGVELHLAAQVGVPEALLSEIEHTTPGRGFIGHIYAHGEPLRVPKITDDPRATPLARASGLTRYVGVPIRAKGKVLGVFSILAHSGDVPREQDMTLLSSIADQVGLTVENATLRQQAEHLAVLAERDRLAREIQDSVTQSIRLVTGSIAPVQAAEAERPAEPEREPAPEPIEQLTEREHDVLLLVARGLSNRDIADRLGISERTVRTHVGHVLDKLELSNRTQAALFAVRRGMVTP